ncbi:MAG: transposase [Chloroflexota bacterium]
MNIRRKFVPNAVVYITQVVEYRQPIFEAEQHITLLLEIIREAKRRYPFTMLAYVFLPDHFHLLIRPATHIRYDQIMHSIKPNFTKAYKKSIGLTGPMKFWQKRYWDHTIRNETDLQRRLDYIHYNPVKHGYVMRPEDWTHTSFHHYRARGNYADGWGWSLPDALSHLHPDYGEDNEQYGE